MVHDAEHQRPPVWSLSSQPPSLLFLLRVNLCSIAMSVFLLFVPQAGTTRMPARLQTRKCVARPCSVSLRRIRELHLRCLHRVEITSSAETGVSQRAVAMAPAAAPVPRSRVATTGVAAGLWIFAFTPRYDTER